jgi:hypothetical protein
MSFGKLAVSLLIALSTAAAQPPLPTLRVEPTGGGSILVIRNVAPQPLTGFLIEMLNYPGSYYAYWQDDVTSQPLKAGAEQTTRVANMTIGAVPDYVKIEAALYADGSSSGAAEKVAMLKERSQFAHHTLEMLIQRLEKAQKESMAKETLVAGLKQWSDSLEPAGKPKRYSQTDINNAAARSLIANTMALLADHSLNDALNELRTRDERTAPRNVK